MILTDRDIAKLVDTRRLIENFDENNLQAASYDVTTTNKLYRFINEFRRICLSDKTSVEAIYEEIDIRLGYDLRPGEFVLVTLNEILKMPDNLVAHIRPRTSFTRLGIIVSDQHVNPTYEGRLSLGVYNSTPYVIELVPKLKIAQIIFETLSKTPSNNKLYKNKEDAKYHNETDFIGSKIYDEVDKKYNCIFDMI